jgi:hypothetical protein
MTRPTHAFNQADDVRFSVRLPKKDNDGLVKISQERRTGKNSLIIEAIRRFITTESLAREMRAPA